MERTTSFLCPICRGMLSGEKSLKCEKGHCFDRAKSGYLNLLSGKGGNHGDPKDMVLARKHFLDAGHYSPLAKELSEAVAKITPQRGTVLDCGCGECYYTASVSSLLPDANIMGIDVSKDAVNLGARRLPTADLAVASVYAIPVADASVDTVISIFAPAAIGEFSRVLPTGGHLVMAIGGEYHLWSLKKAVYDTPYKNETADFFIDGFELVDKKRLYYEITLSSNDEIKDLFAMTPYCHKTSREDMAKLDKLTGLVTEIEFELPIYRKL